MTPLNVVDKGSIVIEVQNFNKILSDVSLGVAEISSSEQGGAIGG